MKSTLIYKGRWAFAHLQEIVMLFGMTHVDAVAIAEAIVAVPAVAEATMVTVRPEGRPDTI